MLITFLVAAILACIRVYIVFNFGLEEITFIDIYKDCAHLFIGGLFAAWYIQRHRWQWILFWLLCIVEVVCALGSRL